VGFSDLGIREKLLVFFVSLICLPVSIATLRSYYVASGIIEEKTNQYSHDILYQAAKVVEGRLEKMEGISFSVAFDRDVQEMLLETSVGGTDAYRDTQIRKRIEEVLSSQVLYNGEVDAIFVLSRQGAVYELNKSKQPYGLVAGRFGAIREAKGGTVWFGGSSAERDVALTRVIMSVRTQRPIGYFIMYVDEKYLFEPLSGTKSIRGGSIVMADGGGRIVSAASKELLGRVLSPAYQDAYRQAYSFSRKRLDGVDQYIACSEPMRNRWRVITTVPVLIYQREIYWLRDSIFLFTAILILVSVACAWGLSLSLSRPIRLLSSAMVRFGAGDLSARAPRGGEDEVGRLSQTFNQMGDNIKVLVGKVLEEQRLKRDAELRSLQMQINPHFLYNTLESINWMARMGKADDVCVMVTSLGDLMRASINSRDYVSLREEIASLRNYLQIQKYRYGEKLEYRIDVAAGTEELSVPKLIIQPLVENAIYHGIEPSIGKGLVAIKSFLRGGDLVVAVEDNGVGMSPESIADILAVEEGGGGASAPRPIGMRNVIRRIKTLYGEPYGLEIQSEQYDSTTVTMLLPARPRPREGLPPEEDPGAAGLGAGR